MSNLIIDTNTSYQPYSIAYYQEMKKAGVKTNFVKVSESTNWIANKWLSSVKNSESAGLITGVYHFLRATNVSQGQNEGEYFAHTLDKAQIPKSIKIMIDAETIGNNTNNILACINQIKKHGYSQFTVYSGRYLWITKVLDQNKIPRPWVACYPPVKDLGINNAQAWQYASTFNGRNQDISKDLTKDKWFTTEHKSVSKPPVKHTTTTAQGVLDVAKEVIAGKYGTGQKRKDNLYNHVQNAINLKSSGHWHSQESHGIALIADDVLFNKKYGTGQARKNNIYNTVQKEVDNLLK